MHVIKGAGQPNRSEKAVVAALRPGQGVAATTVLLPGRRTIEVDVLLVTSAGVATIEAKGTALTGAVAAHPNGDWTIGGVLADFPSGANPTIQARTQAQVAAGVLRDAGVAVPRITAFVVVTGDGALSVPGGWAQVTADVVVTTPKHLLAALAAVMGPAADRFGDRLGLTRHSPVLAADTAALVLTTLGLPPASVPSVAQLADEAFPQDTLDIPTPTSGGYQGAFASSTMHNRPSGRQLTQEMIAERKAARVKAEVERARTTPARRRRRRRVGAVLLVATAAAAAWVARPKPVPESELLAFADKVAGACGTQVPATPVEKDTSKGTRAAFVKVPCPKGKLTSAKKAVALLPAAARVKPEVYKPQWNDNWAWGAAGLDGKTAYLTYRYPDHVYIGAAYKRDR